MNRLAGCAVATTRDGDPDDALVAALRADGAFVRSWRTLRFLPTGRPDRLRRAAEGIADYGLVVFTSARGVDAMAPLVREPPGTVPIAAVGRATNAALREAGWNVAVTGDAGAAALAERLATHMDLDGVRVLFPAGSAARSTVEEALRTRGALVDRVEAYRTVAVAPDRERVRLDLSRGVDIVTFTSPSAIASLASALEPDWPAVLAPCSVVVIGRTTAGAARVQGLPDVEIARAPDITCMVDTCVDVYTRRKASPSAPGV